MSPQELREDVSVLNVVNFGGGAYVIYAEVLPTGRDRGRPGAVLGHLRPPGAAAADRGQGAGRGDRPDRARPRRPALRAREGRRRARVRPGRGGPAHRLPDRRTTTSRTRSSWPCTRTGCSSSSTGRRPRTATPSASSSRTRSSTAARRWYVAAWDLERGRLQHFRLDRIKRAAALLEHFEPREGLNPIADIGGWPRTGQDRRLARGARADLRASRRAGRASSGRVLAELAGRRHHRRDHASRASSSSSARCSRRRATRSCSSPPTRARPCWPPPRA